jgi:hypothetical protein
MVPAGVSSSLVTAVLTLLVLGSAADTATTGVAGVRVGVGKAAVWCKW